MQKERQFYNYLIFKEY